MITAIVNTIPKPDKIRKFSYVCFFFLTFAFGLLKYCEVGVDGYSNYRQPKN